ncbi:CpaD family pilus assembly lipoprotein [Hyphococcus luteus]|uniref:Lipoprotein n=1 Tax=Hyphococcus luteus TaxID=2058213 RepID=A0A2S7K5U3_9PROT|nr:CpaD family pilus assembly lipoprotein [Marinicaulis flavus]PQA87884.1 hypothetical protein CW354_05915 [Marinicaulis flavus]
MKKGCEIILCAALSALFGGCATPDSERAALPLACPSAADAGARAEFGCVNKANLAVMAADPGDLKEGGDLGPGDGARAAMTVEAYKEGKNKGLEKSESTTSASINLGGEK